MKSTRVYQPVLIQFSQRESRAISAPPKRQRESISNAPKEEKKKMRRSFSSLKKSLAPCHRHRIKALVEKEKQESKPRKPTISGLGVKKRRPSAKTPKRKVTFQDSFMANSTFKTPQRLPPPEQGLSVQIEECKEDSAQTAQNQDSQTPKTTKGDANGPKFSPFILRTGRLRPEGVQIVDKKKTLSFKLEKSSSEKLLKSRKKEQLLNLLAIDRVHAKVLDDMVCKESSELSIEKTLGEKEKNMQLFRKLLKSKERSSSTPKFRSTHLSLKHKS